MIVICPTCHSELFARTQERAQALYDKLHDAIGADTSLVEIIGPDGKVHYRRPWNDKDVQEAFNTLGYSVRKATTDNQVSVPAGSEVPFDVGKQDPFTMRDIEAHPYSADERRVCDFLLSRSPDMGCGNDPIGFLMASYVWAIHERNELRDAATPTLERALDPVVDERNSIEPATKCVKCGHTKWIGVYGGCRHEIDVVDNEISTVHICNCKCDFSVPDGE